MDNAGVTALRRCYAAARMLGRMAGRRVLGATAVTIAVSAAAAVLAAPAAATSTSKVTWSFVSQPGLHPPKLEVLERKSGLAAGDFLLASEARGGHSQSGPLIVQRNGQAVWFLDTRLGLDFEQETYNGKPVLVWTKGRSVVVVNEHYRKIATVKAHRPWMLDGHDAQIIGGDIWITVNRMVPWDLKPYGGPSSGTVLDCGVQEYQLSTGQLIGTWDALNPHGTANVPLSASKVRFNSHFPFWDAYHINAVQPLPNGDLLISMRNTWAVYLVDPATDQTLWTLGGKQSSFSFGRGAKFALQHDARLVDPSQGGLGSDVELTVFDDNAHGRPSKGIVLSLNTTTYQATLVQAYHHDLSLRVGVEGSMQLLPNGNALVGWGAEPYFSEYSAAGAQLLDVRLPPLDSSYRALFTNTWVGTPYYPPRGAVRGKTAYASWNGATQVAKWQVLAGASSHHLKVVAVHKRTGFETAIRLGKTYGAYEVRALSSTGQILGTSKSFS